MMTDTFFAALADRLNLARTPWRRAWFDRWSDFEGTPDWIHNPLATTHPGRRSTEDIGWGPGKWNNANPPLGVGIYADELAGVEATAATLNNGYYPAVLQALRDQRVDDGVVVASQIRTWGTTGFADAIRDGWLPDEAAATPTELTGNIETRLQSLNDAVNALARSIGQLPDGVTAADTNQSLLNLNTVVHDLANRIATLENLDSDRVADTMDGQSAAHLASARLQAAMDALVEGTVAAAAAARPA